MLSLSSADIFQNHFFHTILSEIPSECQTVRTQIKTDIKSVLIWVKTVCKGFQQTTKVAANMERVKEENISKYGFAL